MGKDQNKRKRRREEGFTLVEIMAAIAILSFGILAVASMQTNAIRSNYRGYLLTEATTLAQDRLEYLRTQPYVDLVEGDDQADPDPANPRPEITYDVEPVPGGSGITGWLITVRVQLQGEREREISFIRIPMKGA